MAEIAPNVERIYPEGAPDDMYVFSADTVPPRFAVVYTDDGHVTACGPLDKRQLQIEVTSAAGRFLSPAEQAAYSAPNDTDYNVESFDIAVEGDYPGGRERLALNAGRLMLGA